VGDLGSVADPSFDVDVTLLDVVAVIGARGEVDAVSAPRLADAVCEGWGRARTALVVGLTAVGFFASVGMTIPPRGSPGTRPTRREGSVSSPTDRPPAVP
jgi:hypothetical protein